jgi:uncharacterized protein (DUF924 family)
MHGPPDILEFWFDGASDETRLERGDPSYQRWFGHDEGTDAYITKEFGVDVARARSGELDHWRTAPLDALALILLLDQFPRHIWRGNAAAFASDAAALTLALACIDARMDQDLSLCEQVFLYLPMQHSERLDDHEHSLRGYAALVEQASAKRLPILGFCQAALKAEHEHVETLRRFGRYPYRNAALGRLSTPAEATWLTTQSH